MVTKPKLSVQQQLFVNAIIAGKTQRESYIDAGYKYKNENTLAANASILISNHKIANAIAEHKAELAEKSTWTAQRIINSFEEIVERCMQHTEVLNHKGEGTGEYRFDSGGAIKALENIGKIVGIYAQMEGDQIIVNQFLTQIQNQYGMVETKE